MTDENKKEIQANLQRALESIQAAKTLISTNHFDFAASRAYYAVFYSITAALITEGASFKKHSGVISAFNQRFIKTGKIEKSYGKELNWLFELRSIGDYGISKHVTKEEAEKAIATAQSFVKMIKDMID